MPMDPGIGGIADYSFSEALTRCKISDNKLITNELFYDVEQTK